MKSYAKLCRISFSSNLVYKADYVTGVINNILSIFVAVAIWKAVYGSNHQVQGIELNALITYLSVVILLQTIFTMDDFFLEKKIRTGEIAVDLLKPVDIKAYIFSFITGTTLFKLVMQLLPSLLAVSLFFKILPPSSFSFGFFFVLSSLLGYLVLYNLNFIFWVSSFWFYVSWSVITIKDALIVILSGVVFPLWFMPEVLREILKYLPFDSIFYIPVSIYLGRMSLDAVWLHILKQGIWAFILFGIGDFLWRKGVRKLVIQGG